MSSKALITLVILSLAVLASCVAVGQQPLDCDEITFLTLRSTFLKPSPTLESWVSDTYGVTPEYSDADNTDELNLLRWSHNGTQFTVHVRDSTPIGAVVSFGSHENPTADEVIACLAVPEFYCASHGSDVETTKSELILRFPGESIDAYGYRFDVIPRQRAPTISGGFPIARMTIGNVLSSQDLTGQSSGADAVQLFRPWPGNWQAIEIDAESCLNRQ